MEQAQAAAVKSGLKVRAARIDAFFRQCIPARAPSRLAEAMRYSLTAGGKRLRPALCLTFAALAGLQEDKALPFAAAIEMIHTYSLIHDDLPAMDDDDFRRGKPSCHRQFDEATAILAGDGLLADAFALAASTSLEPANVLAALAELARATGSAGMTGGQMLDMQYTGASAISQEQIAEMQRMKTGAIIRASCLCGALLAGAPPQLLESAGAYGASLGLAFQITDDILDITSCQEELGKPQGSDARKGKNTWPALLGVAESLELARAEAEKAKKAVPDGAEAPFLAGLADYVVCRSA